MSGDFTVTVNPQETRGREIQIVVEAKTGRLSGPKARKALEASIKSRAAAACVLVFDDASDAPLNGRSYCPYPDGRFIVVFDQKEQDPLALEVACRQARAIAIASIESDEGIDVGWLDEQCGQLATIVDKAKDIKLGTNAAKRGLETVELVALTETCARRPWRSWTPSSIAWPDRPDLRSGEGLTWGRPR